MPGKDRSEVGTRFADFLCSLVGFSLSEFLLNEDRRKLKECECCHRYTVAKKAAKEGQRKFCSESCKDQYWREDRKEKKYSTKYMRRYREY